MVRYDRDSSASDTASRTQQHQKDRTAVNARQDRQNSATIWTVLNNAEQIAVTD